MLVHTNDFENLASNVTRLPPVTFPRDASIRNRGEVIMNRIQKATAAVIALTITLAGAAFVTAPMALADMQPFAFHQETFVLRAQLDGHATVAPISRHG